MMMGLLRKVALQDMLSTGPRAVIKVLPLSRPEIRATDKRPGLLLQMLAATGEVEFIQLLIDRGRRQHLWALLRLCSPSIGTLWSPGMYASPGEICGQASN